MKNEKLKIKLSEKLQRLPPYLFLEIDKAKKKALAEGRDIIDFGIGDPDQQTPKHIIDALAQAARDPANHHYALDQGMQGLRSAIAGWYKKRFNVELDPETEILPLIGSKEGIAHFPLAFLNEGDYSLVPDPCYPPYKAGTILAGAKPYLLPLKEENAFLPDLKRIPLNIRRKAKLIYINYPNNPTAAVAENDFYKDLVRFSVKNKIIVLSDLAYSEIAYDGYRPVSFLEVEGAKEAGIEFHSLSKTYNMAGWRIGWACGNRDLISALAKVKSNVDSGIFSAIQLAGVAALQGPQGHIKSMCRIYQERRDILIKGLNSLALAKGDQTISLGFPRLPSSPLVSPRLRREASAERRALWPLAWQVKPSKTTFYIWIRTPKSMDSVKFANFLLEKADIIVTPGAGFGKYGEGYIRMALTVPKERITEAVERLKRLVHR